MYINVIGLSLAQFKQEPSDTSISDGSEVVVLKCEPEDGSISTTYWYKDGSKLQEDFVKYTFTSSGLRIKPVKKSDAGKYFCMNGVYKSREVTLTVECEYIEGIALSDTGVWRYQTIA